MPKGGWLPLHTACAQGLEAGTALSALPPLAREGGAEQEGVKVVLKWGLHG